MQVTVTGAGGFIGGHLVGRLVGDGHEVVATDIKPISDWHQVHPEAILLPLRDLKELSNCLTAVEGSEHVYNLAADMGGMGFIASHRIECMQSVLITTNILRAAFLEDVDRLFYASSACIYPDHLQQIADPSLRESMAWPADPEPGYGMEKLFGEEIAKYYRLEGGLDTVVARFHNIFGPHGTYDGGREKAPAAICRKVAEAALVGKGQIEIWGDGQQTRSFLFVDECLDGISRIMAANQAEPLNLGSDELVTINQLVDMVEKIADTKLDRVYNLDAPQGVRGRNSNNELIEAKLGWKPSARLSDGLEVTYNWIYEEMKQRYGQSTFTKRDLRSN